MLEPTVWASVALTFMGAQVARKAANSAIETVWDRFAAAYASRFKKPPTANAPAEDAKQVVAADPALTEGIAGVLRDSMALRRARLVAPAIRDARILWIDDVPQNNEWERLMLRQLGAEVTAVTRTETALDCLRAEPFDVVLSDISRGGISNEGVHALSALKAHAPSVAVVFYVGCVDADAGLPKGAAGIADLPDELLHLVMDALERRRL